MIRQPAIEGRADTQISFYDPADLADTSAVAVTVSNSGTTIRPLGSAAIRSALRKHYLTYDAWICGRREVNSSWPPDHSSCCVGVTPRTIIGSGKTITAQG